MQVNSLSSSEYSIYLFYKSLNPWNFNRSVKFKINTKVDIVDAIWHKKSADSNDDWIVCLTSDNNLRYFKAKNPNILLKEFHLTSNLLSQIEIESNPKSKG